MSPRKVLAMKKLLPLLALLVCIFERGRTLTCMRKMQLIVPRGIAATNIRKWESATTRRFITGLPAVPSGEDEYWSRQKELIQEMQDTVDKEKSSEQKVKFAERQRGLVFDTAYIGFLISCILWIYFENPFVTISYALGSSLGLAYAYGLGTLLDIDFFFCHPSAFEILVEFCIGL